MVATMATPICNSSHTALLSEGGQTLYNDIPARHRLQRNKKFSILFKFTQLVSEEWQFLGEMIFRILSLWEIPQYLSKLNNLYLLPTARMYVCLLMYLWVRRYFSEEESELYRAGSNRAVHQRPWNCRQVNCYSTDQKLPCKLFTEPTGCRTNA